MLAQPLFLLLLPLVVFLPPSHGCRYANLAECRRTRFVPGHNLVGEGFDIVKMKTTGASVVDMIQFMKGNKCMLCYNSLVNKEQKLPVAVADWRVKVRCRRSVSSRTFSSTTSVLRESSKSTSTSWKIGLGFKGASVSLAGSHSKSSSFAMERGQKDKYSYSSQNINCHYYTFRLHTVPPLGKDFTNSLKRLPVTGKPTDVAYQQFLALYGTHFIRRVHLGGSVKSITAIRTCETAMKGVKASAVSNCLSVEASATIKGVTASGALKHCKEQSKKFGTGQSFSASFTDRTTEVLGGHDFGDVLLGKSGSYNKWLASLKWVPGLVTYELSSIHMLVRNNPKLRAKLREAIRSYLTRSAVPLKCTTKCKNGHPNSDCVCKCSSNGDVDGDCCPKRPGGATMTVTIIRATGTWGDWTTKTDGYARIRYGKDYYTSRVVWNNNAPTWNHKRVIKADLPRRTPLVLEVWDKDSGWNDDKLGYAKITPKQGKFTRWYRLNHGSMYVSVSVVCLPRLTGAFCNQYLPEPEHSMKKKWGLSMALDAPTPQGKP